MPLPAGTHVGPYEILALIGAGGMGEVYRARYQAKTRGGTESAARALHRRPRAHGPFPAGSRGVGFSESPQHRAYLRRRGSRPALVMELVEGPTLSSPLPLQTARNYVRQIAE